VADREQLHAAIVARLERATPENNFAPTLEPSSLEEIRLVGEALAGASDDVDPEGRYLLAWLHLYRSYALQSGESQQEYDTAVRLFAQYFTAGFDVIPASLLPAVIRRAAATGNRLLNEARDSADHRIAAKTADLWRRIVEATGGDDPARPGRLSSLGLVLLVAYERAGNSADLDAAVVTLRQALEATPGGDPLRPGRLSDLAVVLLTRFDRTENREDLDRAIPLTAAAVETAAADDPDRAMYLSNHAAALKNRFDWTGRLSDLDDVIAAQREAVRATPAGHAGLHRHLTNQAVAHQTRFIHAGDIADCDAAIRAQRAAIEAVPASHPNLPTMLANLAAMYNRRFDRTGAAADLDAAIGAGREAVAAGGADDPGQSARLANLATTLVNRFNQTGGQADLDAAIERYRAAVNASPPDDRDRATCLSLLGRALHARFRRTGAVTDLNAAITAEQAAVSALPRDHPDRPHYHHNLGISLMSRFDRSGERRDLDDAIEAVTAAVDVTPAGHPSRPMYLSNLAILMMHRVGEDGSVDDVAATVRLERQALDLTPADHPSRPAYLRLLGSGLTVTGTIASDRAEALAALREAIKVLRHATRATPADDPHLASRLASLGDALAARLRRTRAKRDREAAINAYSQAASLELADPPTRIRAARAAADLVPDADPGRAADFLETAVRLLADIAPRMLPQGDQQHQVREFAGLASDAAAFALADERGTDAATRAVRALSLLEAGRAVLLTQLLGTRDDLTDLRRQRPAAARRFTKLRELLDAPDDTSGVVDPAAVSALGQAAEVRRRLAAEFTEILRKIRATEGFASFGLPPGIEELTAQAAAGPVVTVNVGARRSDALLLRPDGVTAVALPMLARDELARHIRAFHAALAAAVAPDVSLAAQRAAHDAMGDVLGWLWDAAAEPVLDALGFRESPTGEAAWPRVWWAPGGLLGLLPIHAAGHHADRGTGRAVMDRVISSYTPTVRALAYARQHPRDLPGRPRSLIVGMPVTPGLPGGWPLPGVPEEINAIRSLLPRPMTLLEPLGPDTGAAGTAPTRAEVFSRLPECTFAHFACHAASDPGDPSQSLLYLHDHDTAPLTVRSLGPVQHDRLRLVFLSACRTAYTADTDLLDEAIHLTSAFLLAGARHVIGTLWEVHDVIAPEMAAGFYQGLRTRAGTLDTDRAARALHDAVRAVRDRYPRLPFRWAGYLHVGT
jgi:hypothetical protein